MTPLRRFLVFQAFLLWQGGFLFYASFVVPVGTEILGSAAAQGIITTRVTNALNACGAVGLAIIAWDLVRARDPAPRRTTARWCCWGVAAVSQGLLILLHEWMESCMDPGRSRVLVDPPFRPLHRTYLWTSTVQWVACLFLAFWTLRAWVAEGPGRERAHLPRKCDAW